MADLHDFVDLDRLFIPVDKDKEPLLDSGAHWGRKYGGWLTWADLLQSRRVVILAEALSGKTKELEWQTERLRANGAAAFFVRIEDLADRGFGAALDEGELARFTQWKAATAGDAWFFLDSVDEARLNNKSLPAALLTFRKELGLDNLNRAFVVVTCRVSDWKGRPDITAIREALPYQEPPKPFPPMDEDEALLAPIFNKERNTNNTSPAKPAVSPGELIVVQLAPLSDEQKARFATARGTDSRVFLEAVNKSGLASMVERPGDLIDLLSYWEDHRQFGSLREMTEAAIDRKLRENNAYRADGALLSSSQARQGAEQLAAALVLGKTFTLKSPGQEPDPTLSKGALVPGSVLNDWSQPAVNALLRKGIFAPSTYGRVRFHHRATQEYLAACWIRSLLQNHTCPLHAVHRLLFAEPYGVPTAVPGLLPVSAWLAQWIPQVRDELVKREPVALIVHGDPKSLPLPIREALLDSYARLDAADRLDNESIDHRAAWMFSSPELASAVRRAWTLNTKPAFRLDLLRFIREGKIEACVDLARPVALNTAEDQYLRIVAAQALVACEDRRGLKQLADLVRAEPDRLNARLAPEFATLLYPNHLSTRDLIDLIDRSEQARSFSSEGFSHHLADLHTKAPSRDDQRCLVAGIAHLVRPSLPEWNDDTEPPASRFSELCNGTAALAKAELLHSGTGEVHEGMLHLLLAVERARHSYDDQTLIPEIRALVAANSALKRQLMWADASTTRLGVSRQQPAVHIYQVGPHTERELWSLDTSDIAWLAKDASQMPEESQRRVAFSAIVVHARRQDQWEVHKDLIERLAAADPLLRSDLTQFLSPPKEPTWGAEERAHLRKHKAQQEEAQNSWRIFRDELTAEPSILDSSEAVSSWQGGLHRLCDLTRWVRGRAASSARQDLSDWRSISTVFGNDVAEHYAAGMRLAWRAIKPERPRITGSNTFTTKKTSQLAIDALEIESLTEGWTCGLTEQESRIAIQHAVMAGSLRAKWVDELILAKPLIVLPVIEDAARHEFKSGGLRGDVLSTVAYHDTPARERVTPVVLAMLRSKEPSTQNALHSCLQILRRGVGYVHKKDLHKLAMRRIALHLSAGNEDRAFDYLGLLAILDGEAVAKIALEQLRPIQSEATEHHAAKVERWIGALFDTRSSTSTASASLASMSTSSLVQLLCMAYRFVPPAADRQEDSDSTVRPLDRAEGGRSALLTTLVYRPGYEAYAATLGLAEDEAFANLASRMRELAHRKAQADADYAAWTETEVVDFGRRYVAPAKTGGDLLRLTLDILKDIAGSLTNADASSRSLLAQAQDEEQVQQWLAERLAERSHQRYHAHREPEVAHRNAPDITVSSTSSSAEVAVEVKNANMGWTVRQLEKAIVEQLADSYLLPQNRRHGVLVVSIHRDRSWRIGSETWDFDRVIAHLESCALSTVSNRTGSIEVKVASIDAREPEPGGKAVGRRRPSRAQRAKVGRAS